MLNRNQFVVLADSASYEVDTQRTISERIGVSLGTVNTAARELKDTGFLAAEGRAKPSGFEALRPYNDGLSAIHCDRWNASLPVSQRLLQPEFACVRG